MLIPELLAKTAKAYPDKAALVFEGFTLTYRQLQDSAGRLAGALQSLGVQKGDRVLLFLPNCPHFIISYYAVLLSGGIVVPANPLYNEQELAYYIKDSGAETVITLDLLYSRIAAVQDDVPLKRVVVGKIQDFLPRMKKLVYPIIAQKETSKIRIEEKAGLYDFHSLLKKYRAAGNKTQADSDDIAMLQYTGGTTGIAKGAMLSHSNIISNNRQMRNWYVDIREGEEIFISVLPFFHTYGLSVAMNLPVSIGATMIIFPKFAAKDILKGITQYRATVLPGIPSIYSVLNTYKDIKKYDISSIRFCLSGAAPLPDTVLEEFEAATGGIILEGYGLSESSPVSHCNPIRGKRKIGSIGLPLDDTRCKIVDIETGEPLPDGAAGELCLKGPQVMQGYWNKEDETGETLQSGWLFTGDIAYRDEEGYYFIAERKKDMIISEGFNIYPREIEEFLITHPGIADAAVIGIPDKLRGERVLAYVVTKSGQTVSSDEIISFCKEHLVKYKVPKKVLITDQIPTNIAGKKLRRALREESQSE